MSIHRLTPQNKNSTVVCHLSFAIVFLAERLLAHWHRGSDSRLQRGLLNLSSKYKANFDIYTPYNLVSCPYIDILCRGVHSHTNPFPVKTPPPILDILMNLLVGLGWKLADALPRKLSLDSGFIHRLREHLNWMDQTDPSLSALHPSLGNLVHVRRHITLLRNNYFPKGTEFEGAEILLVSGFGPWLT